MIMSSGGYDRFVEGKIVRGHQIASGMAENGPYPQGSIKLQMPFFSAGGLDLSHFYSATLNVSIKPQGYQILKPDFFFQAVQWTKEHPPENFSFIKCEIQSQEEYQKGYIYYPHPETKATHFQDDYTLEIITYYLKGMSYGKTVSLRFHSENIDIF